MTISSRRRATSIVTLLDDRVATEGRGPDSASARPPETFEAFYLRELPRLLVLARALGGAAGAEDLAQESMLAAYRRWPQICELDSPAGYVRGICLNKAASATRRVIAERRALQRFSARPTARMEALTPEHESFWAAVRGLPERQAQCAALFYALDLPVAEIAGTLGCAEGTVKAHLSRARAALRDTFGETQEPS